MLTEPGCRRHSTPSGTPEVESSFPISRPNFSFGSIKSISSYPSLWHSSRQRLCDMPSVLVTRQHGFDIYSQVWWQEQQLFFKLTDIQNISRRRNVDQRRCHLKWDDLPVSLSAQQSLAYRWQFSCTAKNPSTSSFRPRFVGSSSDFSRPGRFWKISIPIRVVGKEKTITPTPFHRFLAASISSSSPWPWRIWASLTSEEW